MAIWVVVKIMVPFWIPIIVIRHLIFWVPKKGTIILTTTHIDVEMFFKSCWRASVRTGLCWGVYEETLTFLEKTLSSTVESLGTQNLEEYPWTRGCGLSLSSQCAFCAACTLFFSLFRRGTPCRQMPM